MRLLKPGRHTLKEILDFQPAARLEQVGDKRPKQVKDGKHHMR
jgi:hypothetical protein